MLDGLDSIPVCGETDSWVFPGWGLCWGTRAEQIWAGCRCPFHLGAVVLVFHCLEAAVCEFLLLFLSPGILTGARGCLQSALSTHISHSGKRKAGLRVLCPLLSPAPGGSCSAYGDAQGCASTFGDGPKSRGSGQGLWGWGQPGDLSMAESLLWCEEALQD